MYIIFDGILWKFARISVGIRTESLAGGAATPPETPARGKNGGQRPPKRRPKLAQKNGAEFPFGFRKVLGDAVTILPFRAICYGLRKPCPRNLPKSPNELLYFTFKFASKINFE